MIDIPQKVEKNRNEEMPQRIRKTVWKEPKRKHAPTWTLEDARDFLSFKHVESVRQLVERGPNNDGLQGYIMMRDNEHLGRVWKPKEGTGYTGIPVFLYDEDVKAWDEAHPRTSSTHAATTEAVYGALDKQEILDMIAKHGLEHPEIAYNEETGHGAVNRSGLQKLLIAEHGATWESRGYRKIKAVLDEGGYPLLPGRTDTSTRRRRIDTFKRGENAV